MITNTLSGIEFPISKNDYCKIEKQNKICINVFCYENRIVYPLYISGKTFSDCMDLLLLFDENKSHTCILKILTDLCLMKRRIKRKSAFVGVLCSVLVVKIF